jgi:Protein of unknown function (DUF2914)/Helix-turn-helix domain
MTAPTSVGQRLKAERERRGIGRVAVTRATKIYAHHIAALEFGRYEELPEGQVEPSVRAYAEHLGLDGEAFAADLRRERGLPEAPSQPAMALPPPPSVPIAPPRSKAPLIAALVVPVALAIVAGAWWGTRAPRESPARPAPPVTVSPPVIDVPQSSPAPPPPALPPAALSVVEHGVGRDIEGHRLTGVSGSFEEGTEVWFWTDVRGGTAGETVDHVWLREGRAVQRVPLMLGGARWRTQSAMELPPGGSGDWSVEARDGAGHVLARDGFTCVRRSPGLRPGDPR